MAFRSFRSKLLAAFLLLALLAVAATSWPASVGATAALRQTTYDRLTSIQETKRRSVEDYFSDLTNSVLALSTDESSIVALERFGAAWGSLPRVEAGDARYDALVAYYRDHFAPRVSHQLPADEVVQRWLPGEAATRGLQHLFISGNPHPVGSKDLLLAPESDAEYADVHAQYHPTFHRYQTALGFYDIFLIDAREGRIVYTVFKEIDVGMRLTEAPYRGTGLARVYERALALASPDQAVIEDYAPYVASYFAPAAFVATPVLRGGATIGVLAVQVSIERVNRVMTGDQAWEREGMGRTGHTYIVGPDGTLRSDLRFEIEEPDTFFRQIRDAGTDPAVIDRIRRDGTAILNLSLPPALARRLFGPGGGTEIGTDVRSREVIRSHTALELPGLRWALVAEMETAEAFAPVGALRRRLIWSAASIGVVFLAVAWVLARSVTRPVTALLDGTRRLGGQDFDVRLPVESSDEVGQLAESFNAMAERLRRTTVSRDELDRANQELSVKRQQLEQLTERLISAQEEERRRLARELHDDLTQRLAAVAITAGSLKQLPDDAAQQWRDGLRQVQEQLARIAHDVHGLSRRLHSAPLEDLGLVAAIEGECRGFFERGGPPVELTHAGPIHRLSNDRQLALYRIVQEGLRNVLRHAGASEVTLDLQAAADGVELRLADNGAGFDPRPGQGRPGLGLASMSERARLAGGTLTVESTPGHGTRLLVRVPLEDPS